MSLRSRHLKDDLLWLKWPLLMLLLVVCASISMFVTSNLYSENMQRQEMNALGDFDLLTGQVEAIAESERIIIENIENFNSMVANSVLDEEDRVALLQDIGSIRQRYNLFPISVEISEQQRTVLEYNAAVEFPDEEISLRGTVIGISLPLLHEADLERFLADFLRTGRLIVSSECSIRELVLEERDQMSVVPHQIANCEFYWYTFQRERFEAS